MSLNLNDLRQACFHVAKTRTTLSGVALTSPSRMAILSEQFYCIASERAKECFDLGRDPKLVNRAVWFLAQIKICVEQNKETIWFDNCLGILLEVAFPNSDILEHGRGDFLGYLYNQFNSHKEEAWG